MTPNGSVTSSDLDISFPTDRPEQRQEYTQALDVKLRASRAALHAKPDNPLTSEFFPDGKRSLSGIAIRAFCLGCTAVLGFLLTGILAYNGSRLWRPWLFLATLSIFHFLEFYTTAAYNTPVAVIASFLLTNGNQYRQAHTAAFIETCITSYFLSDWQARVHPPWVLAIGIIMVVMGQTVRSVAMIQAGTNFNHTVQSRKNDGHELVTSGIYAYFRHPSYFGFFWWGVGTQLMLGNTVCFLGYSAVLWIFFKKRITHEEKHLVAFFGDDYEAYRSRTRVWIPFI